MHSLLKIKFFREEVLRELLHHVISCKWET